MNKRISEEGSEIKILHLSDLHFGEEADDNKYFTPQTALKTLWGWLTNDLQKPLLPIDLVLITGDIVKDGSSANSFGRALTSLNDLSTQLGIKHNRFFFVPGNHDINCSDATSRGITSERFLNYISFVRNFYMYSGAPTRIRLPGKSKSCDSLTTAAVVFDSVKCIDLLLMNSVWNYNYQAPSEEKEISISPSELDSFKENCSSLNARSTVKIALMHNSPLETRGENQKIVQNSGQLLDVLSTCGVSLILHGDIHSSQHAAVTRDLKSRPLYIVGAGRVDPGTAGVPHFHLVSIKQWNLLGSVEFDIFSYQISPRGITPQGEMSYNLCTPIKEISSSKASIHLFELAEPFRHEYKYRTGKDLLFAFRAKTFEFIKDKSKELLEKKLTEFEPDRMYTLFYESIFECGQKGDIFRAVHSHDWRVWLKDTSAHEIIPKHSEAAKNPGIDIERIIILKNADIEKINYDKNERESLLKLSSLMKEFCVPRKRGQGCFNTFIIREKDLKKFKLQEVGGYGKSSLEKKISAGNIALYTKAKRLSTSNETNTLVFFYEEVNDNILKAHLSVKDLFVNKIRELIQTLWKESKIIDITNLREERDVLNFVKTGRVL
ncbi:MAG: metallophosphoesterase [Nitrospirota bacterium]